MLRQLATIEAPQFLSGAEFELMTYENAVANLQGTALEGKLRHTDDREFPDIVVADLFGIEVKATKKDDWTSIGNSVLESSRVDGLEKIYMFFGKLGGKPDVMYRNYEDCLRGISVTHYPRYQIDMLLDAKDSIFKKMGTDYEAIRMSNNPIAPIRRYYKEKMQEGDALWWISDDTEEVPNLSPIIKNFSTLDSSEKQNIKICIFALFPEIFSASSKKYSRIPAYLAAQHGVVMSNVRDLFSAGGKTEISFNGQIFKVPQIVGELLRSAIHISEYLNGIEAKQINAYWRKKIADFSTTENAWIAEVDRNTRDMNLPYDVSSLYSAALSGKISF